MGNSKCEIGADPIEVSELPLMDLRDTRLFYQTHGPAQPSRPPVVLLHGLGSCSDDWELQLPALTDERRVLAVDLRGHGQSARADRRFRIRDLAGDVSDLARDLDLGPAHWVGLSLGALVALQAAVDSPEQIRSLTLVNGFACLRLHWASAFSGAGRIALLLSGRMDWMGRWVARSLFPHESQGDLRRVAARRIGGNDRGTYIRTLLAVASFDVRNELPGIGQPSLVVAGAEDRIVPMAAKMVLAESLPHARLEVFPRSGHATPIDSAPEFNRLLVDFLNGADELAI
jgi:pimeloyl-ACP methyl ester carboxylesterase